MLNLKPYQLTGLALIRIITGALMTFHGLEIFEANKMNEYQTWNQIQSLPAPAVFAYAGKAAELISGSCFIFGVLMRPAAILMAIPMLFISFFIGDGIIWMGDQHPFIFALLALVYFFLGPVKWSITQLNDNKKKKRP